MPKLTPKVQHAAVIASLEEGATLDEIERDHPELVEGVALERTAVKEQDALPKGSGPIESPPRQRLSLS